MDPELNQRFLHFINQSIEILNLSTRTLRALKKNDINYIFHLLNTSMSDLVAFERMNQQSAMETNDAMCEFGLGVGTFGKQDLALMVPMWARMVAVTKVGDQEIATLKDIISGNKKLKDFKFLNRHEQLDFLAKLGVFRIRDLAKLTKSELYKISGLGKSSADKLASLLATSGRSFRSEPGNSEALIFNRTQDVTKDISPQDSEGLWKLHHYHGLLGSRARTLLSDCGIKSVQQLENLDFNNLPFAWGRQISFGEKSKRDIKMIAEIYAIELKTST